MGFKKKIKFFFGRKFVRTAKKGPPPFWKRASFNSQARALQSKTHYESLEARVASARDYVVLLLLRQIDEANRIA